MWYVLERNLLSSEFLFRPVEEKLSAESLEVTADGRLVGLSMENGLSILPSNGLSVRMADGDSIPSGLSCLFVSRSMVDIVLYGLFQIMFECVGTVIVSRETDG